MRKFLLVSLILLILPCTAQAKSNNWQVFHTNLWGTFYLQSDSITIHSDGEHSWVNVWIKQIPSQEYLDSEAMAYLEKQRALVFSATKFISNFDICEQKHAYRLHEEITYDKDNKILSSRKGASKTWLYYSKESALEFAQKQAQLILLKKETPEKQRPSDKPRQRLTLLQETLLPAPAVVK